MNSSAAPRITAAARGTGLWFVASGNKLRGPFSFEELVVELDSERVSPGDFCWRQGFQEWRPVCSVEEFGISRDRPTLLSPYPSVPLPSTGRVGRRSSGDRRQNSGLSYATPTRPRVVEEHRVVRLRVQKNAKSTVTWIERLGFFFFSILLAYLTATVVTSEFEDGYSRRMYVMRLGKIESLGDPHYTQVPLPYYAAEAVLSANGFTGPEIVVEVDFFGALDQVGVQNYAIGGKRIQGSQPFRAWSPKKMGIDAVYLRQYEVVGRMSPVYPGVVRFLYDGEPNRFVSNSFPLGPFHFR